MLIRDIIQDLVSVAERMRDLDGQTVKEVASAGATSSANIATVANPHIAHSKKKAKMQKPTDNALDMKGVSIFGSPLKR